MSKEKYIFGIIRLSMGWIFLWAFLDKVFGLGFTTTVDKSWLSGASPTLGFLKHGTYGPLSSIFQSIAGNTIVDWLFMLGLLLVGLALILGIGIKIASYAGAIMMFLIWLSALPPKNNPFIDEHIIYILILISFVFIKPGQYLGLGKWWSETKLVQKFPFLQ